MIRVQVPKTDAGVFLQWLYGNGPHSIAKGYMPGYRKDPCKGDDPDTLYLILDLQEDLPEEE